MNVIGQLAIQYESQGYPTPIKELEYTCLEHVL